MVELSQTPVYEPELQRRRRRWKQPELKLHRNRLCSTFDLRPACFCPVSTAAQLVRRNTTAEGGVAPRRFPVGSQPPYLPQLVVDHHVVGLHVSVHDAHAVAVVQSLEERAGLRFLL